MGKRIWLTTYNPYDPFQEVLDKLNNENGPKIIYGPEAISIDEIFNGPSYIKNRPVYDVNIDLIRKKFGKEPEKMKALKCDRCGDLYETKEAKSAIFVEFKFEDVHSEPVSDLTPEALKKRRSNNVEIKACLGHDPDLCPKCREAFKNWWESGVNINFPDTIIKEGET